MPRSRWRWPRGTVLFDSQESELGASWPSSLGPWLLIISNVGSDLNALRLEPAPLSSAFPTINRLISSHLNLRSPRGPMRYDFIIPWSTHRLTVFGCKFRSWLVCLTVSKRLRSDTIICALCTNLSSLWNRNLRSPGHEPGLLTTVYSRNRYLTVLNVKLPTNQFLPVLQICTVYCIGTRNPSIL